MGKRYQLTNTKDKVGIIDTNSNELIFSINTSSKNLYEVNKILNLLNTQEESISRLTVSLTEINKLYWESMDLDDNGL